MADGYQLEKFTEKELENFENLRGQAFAKLYVIDSLDYLLLMAYRFEEYVVEKIDKQGKQYLVLKKNENKGINNFSYAEILNRIEENFELLNPKEQKYYLKLKDLFSLQAGRMQLYQSFPNTQARNIANLLLPEHIEVKEDNKKEKLIWLGELEQAKLLIEEWKKYKFIGKIDTEKVLSMFCDMNGESFSNFKREIIIWDGTDSELTLFFRKMTEQPYKLVSAKQIWQKLSNCFLNSDGDALKPKSLSVSSQKAKPRTSDTIEAILREVCSSKNQS